MVSEKLYNCLKSFCNRIKDSYRFSAPCFPAYCTRVYFCCFQRYRQKLLILPVCIVLCRNWGSTNTYPALFPVITFSLSGLRLQVKNKVRANIRSSKIQYFDHSSDILDFFRCLFRQSSYLRIAVHYSVSTQKNQSRSR